MIQLLRDSQVLGLGACTALVLSAVARPVESGRTVDPCVTDTAVAGVFVADFRYMLDPQAPHRGGISIPLTPPDSIALVTSGSECFAGLDAYNLKATPSGQDPIADSVAVIRIGDHHFAVVNPDIPDHESLEYMVFDASWSFQLIITP